MADVIVKENTNKTAMMARGSNYAAKQARLEKDEKELEELMRMQKGEDPATETEEDVEEVAETTSEPKKKVEESD